jgi:Domain of Unknown Function (DUF1521)
MTSIGQNTGGAANFAAYTPQQIQDGAMLMMAAGLMAQFSNNLGAGPFAFPSMPSFFDVRCGIMPGGCWNPGRGGCIMPEPAAQWTAKVDGQHTAKVDLGDGQRLEIDERNSQITIVNDKTGERTRIWGDPHVEIDGKHAYDFWGTTTFTLENGTKITINTEQWGGNPNAYVASQVVVTKGDNAIVIDGVSQNSLGDLSVTMGNNGYAVDAAHRDGYTLHENATGGGWRTEMGNVATQDDLMATAIGREYGPNSNMPSMAELGENLGAFLFLGMLASFLGIDLGSVLANQGGNARPQERPVERQAEPAPRAPLHELQHGIPDQFTRPLVGDFPLRGPNDVQFA